MNVILFGLVIGFAYSLISVSNMILTARYVISDGMKGGAFASLGTIVAQLIWIIVAILFLRYVGFGIDGHSSIESNITSIFGAGLLFYLAYRVYKAPLPKEDEAGKKRSVEPFAVLFILSMSKYGRFIGYAGLYYLLHIQLDWSDPAKQIILCVATLIGVTVFWGTFVHLVLKKREKFTPRFILKFNRVGAVVLFLMGVFVLISMM